MNLFQEDPRSQTRDLGHPSFFSSTLCVSPSRVELASATANGIDDHRRRSQRNPAPSESSGGQLELDTGTGREAGCRQQDSRGLSVLAPAPIPGAEVVCHSVADSVTPLKNGGHRKAHRRSLGFPGFPVENCGFEQPHVVLFEENHISGTGESCEVGNPGSLGMTKRGGLLNGRGPFLKGQGGCWGGGTPIPSTTPHYPSTATLFVRNQKSHSLSG